MAQGQKPHSPTEKDRTLAQTLSGLGVPQNDIAILIGISKPTLHKHYREDLDRGLAEANAKIAGSLFQQATGGNVAAAIFWTKSRMGWREVNVTEISGTIGIKKVERTIVDPNASNPDS
jgi:predicted transcriptional regulator